MKKILLMALIVVITITFYSYNKAIAFTRITDLVFDGMSVEPDKLGEVLNTIKQNKIANLKVKNPKKKKPTELFTIKARQKDSKNIQLEIDTSENIVRSNKDIQEPISNTAFLNAIQEAVNLWDGVEIADVNFLPLKFASGQADSEDGRNIVTFRAAKAPEGVPASSRVVSIISFARTDLIEFMNKPLMVKPGTILDADIIFDPSNDPCIALSTSVGDFKTGGEDAPIAEGGIKPTADLSMCEDIKVGDITDLAVRTIANVLGLESSATPSAASVRVALDMERYALTSDDEIGLANIYPNKNNLTNHGNIAGRVLLNKKPVKGAYIVLEDTESGEPTAATFTNLTGGFVIMAVPSSTYKVYAEPLDGPVRKAAIPTNFFAFSPDLNFTTGILPAPVTVVKNRTTRVKINVQELAAGAFNINHLTAFLTEKDINEGGGGFLLPIRIMPGETLMDIPFWGSNINPSFGTLSISGSGITIQNVRENKNVPISPFISCQDCEDPTNPGDPPCQRDPRCPATQEIKKAPDEIPGILVDITCAPETPPGPRNIIFTGDQVDETHPSFGLRDQITGGIIVTE